MNAQIAQLLTACEQAVERVGATLLESDRDAILGYVDGLTDDALDKALTVFADDLPSGGIKSEEYGGVKKALIASEPAFDQIVNDKLAGIVDALIAVGKRTATP